MARTDSTRASPSFGVFPLDRVEGPPDSASDAPSSRAQVAWPAP